MLLKDYIDTQNVFVVKEKLSIRKGIMGERIDTFGVREKNISLRKSAKVEKGDRVAVKLNNDGTLFLYQNKLFRFIISEHDFSYYQPTSVRGVYERERKLIRVQEDTEVVNDAGETIFLKTGNYLDVTGDVILLPFYPFFVESFLE